MSKVKLVKHLKAKKGLNPQKGNQSFFAIVGVLFLRCKRKGAKRTSRCFTEFILKIFDECGERPTKRARVYETG